MRNNAGNSGLEQLVGHFSMGGTYTVESPPAKPNQRKADSQASSRIRGVFVNLECVFFFFSGKTEENSQKSVQFAN